MKISIDELLKLKDTVRNEIRETSKEVSHGAYIVINNDLKVDEVTNEQFLSQVNKLDDLRKYARFLNDKLNLVKHETVFDHTTASGEEMELNLEQAQCYVKDLQATVLTYKTLGSQKPVNVTSGYANERIIQEFTYDIPLFKEKAKMLEKEANQLSRLITRISVSTLVDVPDAENFM
ncbi:hypothetical protein ACWV26_10975 [Rummeliibacillus sp. JY-2-4R]